MLSLLVHESVEKWIFETFFKHLSIKKAYKIIHDIAQTIEKQFHVASFGIQSWNEYSKKVEEVWRKENA
jgi:methionine synthase I (cobalamin-dependent)